MSTFPTIAQLVVNELPAGFVVSDSYISMNTALWQELLYIQAQIPEENKNIEAEWPNDWNLLISYMIVYGILQNALLGGILVNSGAGGTSPGKTQKKKIVTGPTEVEFQDTAAAFSTLLKNLTFGEDSIMGILMSNACMIARKVGIKIPFCKGLQIGAMFVKAGVACGYDELLRVITYEVEQQIVDNQTRII